MSNSLDALNSKLNRIATVVICRYVTPTVLQTAVTHDIADLYANRINYAVALTIMEQSGQPHMQVSRLKYEIRSNNVLVVNAEGGGFVSGHTLHVSIIVTKL